SAAAVGDRIDLLIDRAHEGECDLVAKWAQGGEQRGALRLASGKFQADRANQAPLTDAQLRAIAATPGQEVTYTCVPPGSGVRIGVDRDEDGYLDRDELDAGTDPANPESTPPLVTLVQTTSLTLKDGSAPPADPNKRKVSFKSSTKTDPGINRIQPPLPGFPGDPTQDGATIIVYNALNPTSDKATVFLPPGTGWSAVGSNGFKWKSTTAPITSVLLKPNLMKVKG